MLITIEEYNTVVNGLGQQLKLQRAQIAAKSKQLEFQDNHIKQLREELTKLSQAFNAKIVEFNELQKQKGKKK